MRLPFVIAALAFLAPGIARAQSAVPGPLDPSRQAKKFSPAKKVDLPREPAPGQQLVPTAKTLVPWISHPELSTLQDDRASIDVKETRAKKDVPITEVPRRDYVLPDPTVTVRQLDSRYDPTAHQREFSNIAKYQDGLTRADRVADAVTPMPEISKFRFSQLNRFAGGKPPAGAPADAAGTPASVAAPAGGGGASAPPSTSSASH